jgi:hypothetical protein
MVAWPPQVTMLTFISPLPTCSARFTGGTQYGPMAAGVRSIISAPFGVDLARVLGVHVGAGGVEDDLHAVGLHVRARAVDALGGGLDAHLAGTLEAVGFGVDAHHPHRLEHRAALQLGQQVGADVAGADQGALDFAISSGSDFRRSGRAAADAADGHAQVVAGRDRHHGAQRARQHDLAGLERDAQAAQRVGQPGHGVDRRALHGGAGAGGDDLAVLLEHHAGGARSSIARVDRRPPSTKTPQEALSATVSWILIFQSWMRESTISKQGHHALGGAPARRRAVTPGPFRSS